MVSARALLFDALLLFAATVAAHGQSLLLKLPGLEPPPGVQFTTPAASQSVVSQAADSQSAPEPVAFDAALTMVFDAGVLDTPQAKTWGAGLAALFTRNRKLSFEFVALAPGAEPHVELANSRQQVTAAMKSLASGAGTGAGTGATGGSGPLPFAALLAFVRSVPAPATGWSQVLYVGPEPPLASELREYAYGLLLRTLLERHIRFSHCYPQGTAEPAWAPVLRAVAGDVAPSSPAEFAAPSENAASEPGWFAVKIPTWAPAEGFRALPLHFRVGTEDSRQIPWLWTADPQTLPEPAVYGEFLALRAKVAANPPAASADDLARLLAVNPYDLDSLKLAAGFAEHARDYASVIRHAAGVVEMEPANGTHWAMLGYAYWQAGDGVNAERCLLRAREFKADHPQSAAILGDIHLAAKDHAGAAEHYREAVRREPDRVPLWLKLADTQQTLGHKSEAALALEEVLKRQPEMWDKRTQLIDYYLETAGAVAAKRHLQTGIGLLPGDLSLVSRFAVYAERLGQPPDALRLWARTIELDRSYEPGHYGLARIYKDAGTWDKALSAAEAGVAAAPKSARLAALEADALTGLDRLEDARLFLRAETSLIDDRELLRRAADLEDRYGSGSPKYYEPLVAALRGAGEPESVWRPAAERGLRASIREGDNAACERFAQLLGSRQCAPAAPPADASTVSVQGGLRALLFTAHGPQQSSAEAFLADYSRTLSASLGSGKNKTPATEKYREDLIEYFHVLADLAAMGKRDHGKTIVRLSLENKSSAQITERVLGLIGWRTRREGGKRIVEPAAKGKRRRHQDLASALAIDVVSMQESLQAGREFALEMEDEPAEVFPAEKAWQQQFYAGERYAGGFPEAMVRNPAMTALYAALSNMEPGSAELLVQLIGMKRLAEKYGTLLGLYSSCLQIAQGRVQVPGGDSAAPIWAAFTKAQPADPRRFLRELLDKDDGKLLRFYFLLSQLDSRRQRFFTASQARTAAFYDVVRDSYQLEHKRGREFGSASIEDLFREIPIDSDGRLEFPGSPEVWMLAKGKSGSVQTTERRLKKLSRVTTPEVEDEILLRLVRGSYTQSGMRYGEWQNLLAVIRVDQERGDPLDEASALLLAEKFSVAEGLYGYFTHLRGLGAANYSEIFSFAEKVQVLEWKRANLAAGLFQSMLFLFAAAEDSHRHDSHRHDSRRLDPARSAALLLTFCKAMNQAQSPGDWAKASLDALAAYMPAVGAPPASVSLRDILVTDPDRPVALPGGKTVNPGETARRSYDRILELQKVPRLDELLKLHTALGALASGKGDPRPLAVTIIEISKAFQEVENPHASREATPVREMLKIGDPARFAALNTRLQKETARKKLSKDLPKFAAEYWDLLTFRTVEALAGQIYAAHFRAEDLLVAQDPLFLRKHQFALAGERHLYFSIGDLQVSSGGVGSYVTGGFDGMAPVAGAAAAAGLRNVDTNSAFVATALLGSIRTADWTRVTPKTLRAVAVQVHAAQDWLVLAGGDDGLRVAVGAATYGLLSLNRRARLLLALARRDWEAVWPALSLTDLFFLAARLREAGVRYPEQSPVIAEYLAYADAIPEGADALGPTLVNVRRYTTPALVELAPYEDSASELFPAYLAERLAEFKLYLACLFADQALPAGALSAVAEAAAREVLSDIQMTNLHDWQAVISAYSDFDAARLRDVMGSIL
jgi:tetratricopeptide (TPR) repeat protein